MSDISIERWQAIEREVLYLMSDTQRKQYITSMVNWVKRREIATSRVPNTYEHVEVGDVVFADFGVTYDMEMGATHLGLVIAIARGKAFVVPLTSNKRFVWHDNIISIQCDFLDKESVCLCNDAKYINTARVIKIIGKAPEYVWREVKNYVLKGILNNGWQEAEQQDENAV